MFSISIVPTGLVLNRMPNPGTEVFPATFTSSLWDAKWLNSRGPAGFISLCRRIPPKVCPTLNDLSRATLPITYGIKGRVIELPRLLRGNNVPAIQTSSDRFVPAPRSEASTNP